MKGMKRFLAVLLSLSLLLGVGVTAAYADEKPMERYEARFKQIAASYTWGEDDFDYFYHEIADYYSELTDPAAEGAEPDWVLVNAWGPAKEPWYTYTMVGDRVLLGSGSFPFGHDYGIYDVRRDTFTSLESAWQWGAYPELHRIVEENKLGYPVGDADMDHELTVLDATRIQRIIADLAEPLENDSWPGWYPYANLNYISDYDRDGERTVLDATGVQRKLADLEEKQLEYVSSRNVTLDKPFYEGNPVEFELLEQRDDILENNKMYIDYCGAVIQNPAELTDFLGQQMTDYDADFFAHSAIYAARVKISRAYADDFELLDLTAEGEYLYPHFTATGYNTYQSSIAPYTDRLLLYRIDKSTAASTKAMIACADPCPHYPIYPTTVGNGKNLMHLPRSTWNGKLLESGDLGYVFELQGHREKDFNFAVISDPTQIYDFFGKRFLSYDNTYFADKKLLAVAYRDNPVESIYRLREIYGKQDYEEQPRNLTFIVDVNGALSDDAVWKYAFYELTDEEAEKLDSFSVRNAAYGFSENIFFSYDTYFNKYYDMKLGYEVNVKDRDFADDFYMPEDGSPYCTVFYSYDEYINSPIVSKPDEKYDENFFKKSCLIFFAKTYTTRYAINSSNFMIGSDESFSYHVPTVYVSLNTTVENDPANNVTHDYNFWITAPKPTYTDTYNTVQWTEDIAQIENP